MPFGRRDALSFTLSMIVTPFVSVMPEGGLALSQAGVPITYLIVPLDALT